MWVSFCLEGKWGNGGGFTDSEVWATRWEKSCASTSQADSFPLLSVCSMGDTVGESESMSEQCTDLASAPSLIRLAEGFCYSACKFLPYFCFLFIREYVWKDSTYAKEPGVYPMFLHRNEAQDVANVPLDGTVGKGGDGGYGRHIR